MMLAVALAACGLGPTPETRARSAADGTRVVRYDNAHDNVAPPAAPQDAPPASRKFEKH
jgi:hypothetical protein